nr:MAG TPA: hypothetical protein [Caudoviricetes sp.]
MYLLYHIFFDFCKCFFKIYIFFEVFLLPLKIKKRVFELF